MRHKTLKGKSIATRLMRTTAASSPSIRASKDLKLTWAPVCVRSTTVTCLCRPGSMHSLTPGLRVAGCRKPGDWCFLQRKFFPCGHAGSERSEQRAERMNGPTPFLPRGYSVPNVFTHTLIVRMLTACWRAQSHCVGGKVSKAVCARLIVGYNFLILCVFLRKFSELF